jgi:hypothetical protein
MSYTTQYEGAVTQPRELEAIWGEGYADAKARLGAMDAYRAGSEEAEHYERGYLAGMVVRCWGPTS